MTNKFWEINLSDHRGYFVYYIYNESELVYVGFTSEIFTRLGSHMSPTAKYGSKVAGKPITKVVIEKFSGRQEALDTERAAIMTQAPKYNSYVPGGRSHKATVGQMKSAPRKRTVKNRTPKVKSTYHRKTISSWDENGLGIAIVIAYLEGMPITEVAERFSLNAASVYKYISSKTTVKDKLSHRAAAVPRLTAMLEAETNTAKRQTIAKQLGFLKRDRWKHLERLDNSEPSGVS